MCRCIVAPMAGVAAASVPPIHERAVSGIRTFVPGGSPGQAFEAGRALGHGATDVVGPRRGSSDRHPSAIPPLVSLPAIVAGAGLTGPSWRSRSAPRSSASGRRPAPSACRPVARTTRDVADETTASQLGRSDVRVNSMPTTSSASPRRPRRSTLLAIVSRDRRSGLRRAPRRANSATCQPSDNAGAPTHRARKYPLDVGPKY